MHVLFLHQNFPGQFVHVARTLSLMAGQEVIAITDAANTRPDFVRTVRYQFDPCSAGRPHVLGASFSGQAARGAVVATAMEALRKTGFQPDVVIGHLGWGETLFVKEHSVSEH